ncbi:MAG: ROK family protein [Lacrimispora sp.]|uniref:ROK family protein n=1 Tax=Lacrimispora sp. TaxID=2719234 RepID=UPI0039E6B1A8
MYIAALDIGGTKTIAAVLDEKGVILAQENFSSVTANHETHLELCVQAMKNLMQRMDLMAEDFIGLGVSLPGIVNNESGVLIYAPYANWENVAVAEFFRTNIGISKVRCENDVNACAIGEQRFGLGRNYTDFIWMTVSTGVGGAVVEGSQLVRGGHGFAGELGHLKVEYKTPAHCPCGQYGCLEAHGSGTALIRETRKRKLESPAFAKALDEMGLKPDGVGCATLAKAGNTDALEIMDQIGTYLGRGISYCINILDIQAIVIGGGVAASLDLLLPSIRASVQQNAFKRMQDIDIIKTPLGYEAALLGAASLVLEK